MNLKLAQGRVPVRVGSSTIKLVDFPSRGEFDKLYPNLGDDSRDRYWQILKARIEGATMLEAGKPFGITKQRVKQIEAKFLNLMSRRG